MRYDMMSFFLQLVSTGYYAGFCNFLHLAASTRLKEEEARLEMQRRSLGMLQQALFKGATEAKQAPATGLME